MSPRRPARPPSRLPLSSTSLATTALLALSVAGALAACSLSGESGPEIGVYSGRHYNTDKQLYDQFTEQTGIKVKLLEGKDNALIERLQSEGANSPADVLVLADAARLAKAASMDLFQPTRSATLEQEVPANLRDDQGRWFGLTRRVRVVVVNPEQVDPAAVGTYADLAAPALKGKLCLRNSRSVYNQSLTADELEPTQTGRYKVQQMLQQTPAPPPPPKQQPLEANKNPHEQLTEAEKKEKLPDPFKDE